MLEGASLGVFFESIIEHRSLDGRERELADHFKLPANSFPVEMLREPEAEHRAVTPAPSDAGRDATADCPAGFRGWGCRVLGYPNADSPGLGIKCFLS